MASRITLKGFFKRGYKPTEGQFATLIDSFFKKDEDTILVADVSGLQNALAGKASVSQLNGIAPRLSIASTDSRLTNNNGLWRLAWDDSLISLFGSSEANFRILFQNDNGTYKEQKDIAPIYTYQANNVTAVDFEIIIDVNFKIIITK